jgi:ketosteroid isomerase-like protein
MSQADIETLKVGFDAYNKGEYEQVLDTWDEDVEVVRLGGGEPLRGKETIRKWLVPDAIDQRADKIEFRDLGERVLVSCDWHVHGRGSGVEFDTRVFLLFTMRAGKVIRAQGFTGEREALNAAGLPG